MSGAQGPIPRFTREYNSGNQVITAAGALALAHGLGVVPKLVVLELICLTAEFGFAVGAVLERAEWGNAAGGGRGCNVVKTATHVNIRYGLGAQTFGAIDNGTGAAVALTNANWALRLRALA